jgi:hypothetical protein
MISTKHKQVLLSQDILGPLEETGSVSSFSESEYTTDPYGERGKLDYINENNL